MTYMYVYIYIAVFFFDFREISKQGDWSKSIMIPHIGNKGEGELDCHKLLTVSNSSQWW